MALPGVKGLRILSVYEQLARKEAPERFGCFRKPTSICVFKYVHVLLLQETNDSYLGRVMLSRARIKTAAQYFRSESIN